MLKTTQTIRPAVSFSDFVDDLENAKARWSVRKSELKIASTTRPLALFGFGGKGQFLAEHIRSQCNINLAIYDSSPTKRELAYERGFQVIDNIDALNSGEWVLILGACLAQKEQALSVAGDYIFFQEAACFFEAPHLAHSVSDFSAWIPNNLPELYDVYNALHPASRECFVSVLRFRLSSDPTDLFQVRTSNTEMWIDIPSQYKQRPYDVILDVGAYDGDTLRQFRERFECERGIAVEANEQLFESIRSVGKIYPNGIKIAPTAAWSRRTRLKFEEVRFGMIQVTEDPDGSLEAAPIDTAVSERVDFVKMDIEGAEGEALSGAKSLLKRWLPDLAVAAYHRPDDLVSLKHQIFDQLGYDALNFTLHFGHYSDCVDDSIFYVVKNENPV